DKHLDADVSPKPTIFLPSIAETNLHKAGTYLCLLEKFFPDVIKIHWQEKKSNTILGSQEGSTVKTNDTYMKFSWLTVPEKSLDKEHRCIVRHENNKNGVDQEIIFPPIKTGMCLHISSLRTRL
uniref:Ig-like domain-containing protein n=1 Tax=Colobus angolensis palliatus TaxID=336983 RepID=A0A2K5H808_COLAP